MGKVMMILLLVLGIWAAAEYLQGGSPLASDASSEQASLPSRSGAKVQAAHDESARRREALLAE